MVDRVVIGQRNDGTFGIDLSIPGVSVHSASMKEMIFSSRWPHSSVVHQTGYVSRGSTIVFPALSYIPLALVVVADNGVVSAVRAETYHWFQPPYYKDVGWVEKYVTQPIFHVTASSLKILSTYGDATFSLARYIIFRIPGQ